MLGALQQSLEKSATIVVLFLFRLKVDVALPEELGHVHEGLIYGELEDGAGALHVSQNGLQLCVLDPCTAVGDVELKVFLVQLPATVKLPQL